MYTEKGYDQVVDTPSMQQPALEAAINRLFNSMELIGKLTNELRNKVSEIHPCSTPMSVSAEAPKGKTEGAVRSASAVDRLGFIADDARACCDRLDYTLRNLSEII
jgi:hypothetical protein